MTVSKIREVQMNTLVGTLEVQLDMSLIEGRLQSFTPRTRRASIAACKAVFERTRAAAVYIDPGTTWRFWTYENIFTIEVEAFHDTVVIHDIEITRPRDYSLGAFVVWYDNSLDFYRIPASDGPVNHLADRRTREMAFDAALTHLLIRLRLQSPERRSRIKSARTDMDRLFDSEGETTPKFDTISFDHIAQRLSGEADCRRLGEPEIIMLALGNGDRATVSSCAEVSLLQHLKRHHSSSWPASHHGIVTYRELFGADGRETMSTAADIGIVIGALLFGTAAHRIADPGLVRTRISHAMRALMQGTCINAAGSARHSEVQVMTLRP